MTDFQTLINLISENEKLRREAENYNLGNLIDDLKKYPKDASIEIKPFNLYPTGLTSYRGYYEDLAITYNDGNKKLNCGELLKLCEGAIGKKFIGYKGGEFEMSRRTVLWLAPYGRTTDVIVTGLKDEYGDGNYLELTWKIVEDNKND